MDWKYQHFNREAVFQAEADVVLDVARAAAVETLAGWQITDTADGFEAKGQSASHAATAKFRIEPQSSGTKVSITLLVERAGPSGFMLFDIGGYYNRQLRKWLDDIEWRVYQKQTGAVEIKPLQQGDRSSLSATRAGNLLGGCALVSIAFIFVANFICAVFGLLTGHYFIAGGRGSSPITIHGPQARVAAAITLMVYGWLFWRWKKQKQ